MADRLVDSLKDNDVVSAEHISTTGSSKSEAQIKKTKNDPTFDIMDGSTWTIEHILEFGFVSFLDIMPRLVPIGKTADVAIVNAARMSYKGCKPMRDDEILIWYLTEHEHSTPFEFICFTIHVRAPIFIARQWFRHRTGAFNEVSGRYTELQDEFYLPDKNDLFTQDLSNKQASSSIPVIETIGNSFHTSLMENYGQSYKIYKDALNGGISREKARVGLPVATFTEWVWKTDLRNLMHFIHLRSDSHAQPEIQVYSKAMHTILRNFVPLTCKAYDNFVFNSETLSHEEIKAIQSKSNELQSGNKRRDETYKRKLKQLNLIF